MNNDVLMSIRVMSGKVFESLALSGDCSSFFCFGGIWSPIVTDSHCFFLFLFFFLGGGGGGGVTHFFMLRCDILALAFPISSTAVVVAFIIFAMQFL